MNALRRTPWYVVPLLIFLGARLLSAGLLVLLARDQIPASALPPDMPLPTLVDPASYLHVIANWDGQWYREIASHGYPSNLPEHHGVVQQNAWAFYPLFPALARVVMTAGVSFGLAASVVSLLCGALAMCLMYRMLTPGSGRFTAGLTVLALSSAPAAPILQAAYTESLALLLLLTALWGLQERRYAVLTASGVALSLARGITLPLVAVIGWEYLRRRHADEPFDSASRRRLLVSGLVVAASTLLWPAVVAVATGEPDAYWTTQKAWATVAGNSADSWLVSLPGHPGRAVVLLVGIGLLALVCRYARCWPRTLRMWPLPYALFILALTPPTASVLRFSLLLGAPWWPFPEWSRRLASPAGRATVVLTVVAVGLAAQWWWLRTYFVIDPWSHGHP